MKLHSAAALLIVAATGVWAQTAGPSARPLAGRARTVIATTTDADSKTADMRAKAAMNQRVEEMQTTLAKMHAVLKQMQASAAVKNPKDPVTRANLEMWSLMIQQLDKQFDQLKVATREREDMDARRAAMYKQAQEKAAAAARNAQARGNATTQSAGATTATESGSQPQAAQAPQAAPAPSSSSPN